jgi:hypothetical protein
MIENINIVKKLNPDFNFNMQKKHITPKLKIYNPYTPTCVVRGLRWDIQGAAWKPER